MSFFNSSTTRNPKIVCRYSVANVSVSLNEYVYDYWLKPILLIYLTVLFPKVSPAVILTKSVEPECHTQSEASQPSAVKNRKQHIEHDAVVA